MLTMSNNRFFNHSNLALVLVILSAFILAGCASSSSNTASNANSSKAQQKISMAIGQEIDQFKIASQVKIDAPAGYDGTQYSVKTSAGKTYKCDILEASGFGKVITFGTSTGASAMCTDFTKGSVDAGTTNKASCNALLKAAGRC